MSQNTPEAPLYRHRFSGKLQFSVQYCYNGRVLSTNRGNFNFADPLWMNFAQFWGNMGHVTIKLQNFPS